MAIPMRLNTSGIIPIGQYIKSTDGYSPLTGMTSANMTITFTHIGATATGDWTTWAQTANQNITETANGFYTLTICSNPVSKVGRVRIECLASGSSGIPFCEEIQVLPANIYDAIVAASGTDYLLTDIQQIGGSSGEIATGMLDVNVQQFRKTTMTTRAADNLSTFFDNGGVASTKQVGAVSTFTTGQSINVGRFGGATFSTRSGDNIEALLYNAGATVTKIANSLTTMTSANLSTFTTALTVLSNMVQMASYAMTTDAADNFENFFFNNDVVSTERISDLLTTVDGVNVGSIGGATVATGSAQIGVNVVLVSSAAITSEAGANFNYFFDNNSVVSTERVTDIVTTDDILTTDDIMESNVVAMASQALTVAGGANFSTFFDNAGVASTAQVAAMSTFGMSDTVDGMTVLQYMQYDQAYITGDISVVGAATNQFVYDKFGGTTFFSHTITTKTRSFTSN